MLPLLLLLLISVSSIKYYTCPELTGEGSGACEAQPDCMFYEWVTAGNSSFLIVITKPATTIALIWRKQCACSVSIASG